jgi:hypothetical protein
VAIHYATGEVVEPGDRVELDGELSTVEVVIDREIDLRSWGLNERGLMLNNTTLGRVFEPLEGAVLRESVVLLGRKP